MRMNFSFFRSIIPIAVAMFCISTAAQAVEFENNGVYRIIAAYYPSNSISATGASGITYATTNAGDEKQLWVAVADEGNRGYYFRNYVTGFYMASPIVKSGQWYTTTPENLDTNKSIFVITGRDQNGGDNVISPIGFNSASMELQAGYAHSTSGNVICWGNGAAASGWKFEKIDKTPEEVATRIERWGMSPVDRNKAYTIVNTATGHGMAVDPETGSLILTENVDSSDPAQLWVTVSSSSGISYLLRNYLTGYYLTSPLAQNTLWTATYSIMPVDKSMAFTIDFSQAGGNGAVIIPTSTATNSNGFAAENVDGAIVSGGQNSANASWTFNKVETITPEMINEQSKTWYRYAKGVVDGHVYRIVNAGYGHAMSAPNQGDISLSAVNNENKSQLWVAVAKRDGNGYYLRNLVNGYYIHSPRARSTVWTARTSYMLNDDNVLMNIVPSGSYYLIIPISAYGKTGDEATHGFAHEDANAKVVGWSDDSGNSKWTITEVTDITSDEIEAARQGWIDYATDITPGLYRIRNIQYNKNLASNGLKLRGLESNMSDLEQVWIVEDHPEGDGYIIRNYNTGRPIISPRAQSQVWNLSDKYYPEYKVSALCFNRKDNGVGITNVSTYGTVAEGNDYNYAHLDNTNTVVGWVVGSNASRWLFECVRDITEQDLEAKRQTWSIYGSYNVEGALAAIYTDHACTELTPEYANMTLEELDNDPNVQALPEVLQNMVRKSVSGNWTETDEVTGMEWDSEHARKMRIQLYEPFSDCDQACGIVKNWSYNNLNNPTGILGYKGSVLYVMVDELPADGATLTLAMFNSEQTLNPHTPAVSAPGIKLNKGLNVITCDTDLANLIVYYTVYVSGRSYAVQDYQDIKIHIEGGSLNGYFNNEGDALYTPDTNDDWLYYRERARSDAFIFLTKYATLDVLFNDYTYSDGAFRTGVKNIYTPERMARGDIDFPAICRAWDDVCIQELLVMGVASNEDIMFEKAAGRDFYDVLGKDDVTRDDYHNYFNNRIMVLTLKDNYMNAIWHRLAFEPSIATYVLHEFPTGDVWGPAHELGHMNQPPIEIVGTSEISNNLFPNISLYCRGTHTSRADYPSVQRERFSRGECYSQHGYWGGTRMYFQLWLYYHVVGHNKLFYPRLYELLRKNPLSMTAMTAAGQNHYNIKGHYLHFAKMACIAAQEDLTDFFESWGFLTELNGFQIMESNCRAHLTAEDIAQFRAEIAALAAENNWPKNDAIIFIDDRVGSVGKQSYIFDNTRCGAMGGLKDFIEDTPVTGDYTFTISGNTVTVSGGQGGVGFVIHDNEGRLIGFANDPVFTVSAHAAELLSSGQATFDVMRPDNEPVDVVDAIHAGTLEQRLEAMDIVLDKAGQLLAKADANKVGYFLPETMADLRTIYNTAKELRDNGGITVENNVALYDELQNQYNIHAKLVATVDNTVPLIPGAIYVFTDNMNLRGRGISANTQGNQLLQVLPGNIDPDSEYQQWQFIPTGEENYYYIRNVKTGKYVGRTYQDQGIIDLRTEPMKQLVTFWEHGGISISPEGSDHDSLHADAGNRLTRWDASAKASHWTLTLLEDWEEKVAIVDLTAAVKEGESLLARAGKVTVDTDGNVTATPDPQYNMVTASMIENLYISVAQGKSLIADPNATAAAMTETTNEIVNATSELLLAMNRNRDRLIDLIERTLALAKQVGTFTNEIVPLPLTAEHFASNACHNVNGGDKFTSWSVLVDNNPATYFHSTYSRNTDDGQHHYIRIEIPQRLSRAVEDGQPLVFTYTTRQSADNNWFPADATLEYSADGTTWTKITDLKDELPFASATKFESDPFTVPAGTRYIRFVVNKNRKSATNASSDTKNGHDYFVVSEAGLANHVVTSLANTVDYPESNEETINAAVSQLHVAQNTIARPRYTNDNYDAAYDALLPHYQNLLAISEKPAITGVEEVSIGANEGDVIYTLDGLRIEKITRPGVYIVNGAKVFVR